MISLPVVADDSFDAEVISSELPVLVDFWAPWCAPCKALGPIIEELSSLYSGRLKVCQMNVQDNKKIPVQFRIRSIPTLILFKGGKVVDQIIGQVPKNKIDRMIQKAL